MLAQTPPQVRVNKGAKESRVAAGNPVTFTIGVSNAAPTGSAAARNVVVEDTLPTANGLNWTLGSVDPNCTLAGGTLTCRYAELAPSDSRLITVTSTTPVALYPRRRRADGDCRRPGQQVNGPSASGSTRGSGLRARCARGWG